MAYQFTARESVAAGVTRIVCSQIDTAIEALADHARDPHQRVHDVRKHFKKIRAVLRLVRPALGTAYASENSWYRDAARRLSPVRDAEALLEAFGRLEARFRLEVDVTMVEPVRTFLHLRREHIARRQVDLLPHMNALADQLAAARSRVAAWPDLYDDFSTLAPGLRKTYRQGRRRYASIDVYPTPMQYHEWRKATKALWYQCRLLSGIWEPVMNAHVQALDDLSTRLGDLHDLDVFRHTLLDEADRFSGQRLLPLMLWMIARQQAELCTSVATLGHRIYAEQPCAFTSRMGRYWRTWRSESARQPALL